MTSTDVLLGLGDDIRFSVATAAHQTLRRRTEYRWPQQDRLGARPARQFMGPGTETITLDGVIHPLDLRLYPAGDGWDQVPRLRAVAAAGAPLLMTSGLGEVLGWWVITDIEETQAVGWRGMARTIEFRLELAHYGSEGPAAP
ncbi:phage tail protein [Roseospira navarrensis]|nr:phage tail protein [Roseospira navarrensis]